ncbi:hypothetical protein MIMGU_mgv1a026273mg [Erythranthe guttata]|uniref:Uncharacterized protein n=1 Tax=Erythranthe guttata TaxID=4155 RepID=A0A022RYG9_ERYGU|nr:PREDICTED: protein trichome birefringence-like 4 [Erythranthe guttata]EYU44005.1 hypothetical protein MIMGU_mgv1a026273mg [Erythranthe guttata]|eukprot:XP_012828184.1 PREDICTED: protein trichome birefringence-like 4 [Erythranthe guttata]
MDSFKNLCNYFFSKSRTHYFFTTIFTLTLIVFFFLFSACSDGGPASPPAISSTSLPSRRRSPSDELTPLPPPAFLSGARLASQSYTACSTTITIPAEKTAEEKFDSCDIFDGSWVIDEGSKPVYEPGSCPFVDDSFDCFKNGRPDSDYLKLKWKPHACKIPRFDGVKMLKLLKGKRMVFVGDSLNRNMWESLVCAMRESLSDKTKVFEVSGLRQFRSQGFYSFIFKDFNCSIDFVKSPFLVQEWKFLDKAGTRRETLRLDMMEGSYNKYYDADVIVFNTGHWWTHQKTFQGKYYFQEGNHVYNKLAVADAYKKALKTWAQWVDENIDSSKTSVFFRGYSASHFKGGQWNSGGSCDGETKPITNETQLSPYPWMMRALESVLMKMKTPVFYLNITKMTDYRKDGHPSIFRRSSSNIKNRVFQDCSHWCLPGVPDSWNELLYAILVQSQNQKLSSFVH